MASASFYSILEAMGKTDTASRMTTMRANLPITMSQGRRHFANRPKPPIPTGTILMHLLQHKVSSNQISEDAMQAQLESLNHENALLREIMKGKDAALRSTKDAWNMSETHRVCQQISDLAQNIVNESAGNDKAYIIKLREEFSTTDAHDCSSYACSSLNSEFSDSEASSITDATSSCESDFTSKGITHAGKDLNNALLYFKRLKSAFAEKSAKVDDLKERLDNQVRHRRRDFEQVQEYSNAMKELSNDYDTLKTEMQEKLKDKEHELQQLRIAKKELEDAKIQVAHEHTQVLEVMKREGEAIQKAGYDALKHAKQEHIKEQKDLMKVVESNQDEMRSKIASLESQARWLESEIKDNATHAQSEIQSLTARNLQLQNEVSVVKNCCCRGFVHRQEIDTLLKSGKYLRNELTDTKKQLRAAKNHIADLLDHKQRDLNQVNFHLEKEQAAQEKSMALEHKVVELEESVERKNDRIRHILGIDFDGISDEARAVLNADGNSSGPGLHSFAAYVAMRENEELRKTLLKEQEAKMAAEAKAAKLDDEVFRREVEEQFVIADKHKATQTICDLKQTCDLHKETITSLENALSQCHDGSGSALVSFKLQLDRYEQEIGRLQARQYPLENELKDAQFEASTIKNRLDSEIKRLQDTVIAWQASNYEAVNQHARLHERIAELMSEKGEKYYVESEHPFDKAVADRNALRVACGFGDPAGVEFEDEWKGTIAATYDALCALRPLGWVAVQELGKVWLTPTVKPYTEEDALERQQALVEEERMAHRRMMEYPVIGNRLQPVKTNAAPRVTFKRHASQHQLVDKNKRLRHNVQLDAAKPHRAPKGFMDLAIHNDGMGLSYDAKAQNLRSKKTYEAMNRNEKEQYQDFMVENGLVREEKLGEAK